MMEVCINQETGAGVENVIRAEQRRERRLKREAIAQEQAQGRLAQQRSVEVQQEEDMGDGDTEVLSSSSSDELTPPEITDDLAGAMQADGFGTGTTATTSKARLWLARWALRHGELERAERLAEELCMDGYEVEEAKGLVREVRGKREALVGAETAPKPG